MIITCSITSQYDMVSFNVLDRTLQSSCQEAIGTVRGLCITNDATSLVFTNVVMCRSTVKDFATRDLGYQHAISMWSDKGPFTTKQFLKMMNYSREVSPEGWHTHIQTLSQT